MSILTDETVTRVNAVQCDSEMISIDRESRFGGSKRVETHFIEHLSTCVASLRNNIESQLSQEGQCHWGTFFDIVSLSDALQIGFIILKNETDGGVNDLRGWIYGLTASRSDYSHWMLLYCRSSTHFQLAALTYNENKDQAVFAIDEIPEQLREVYDINNPSAKIGQQTSSGMN